MKIHKLTREAYDKIIVAEQQRENLRQKHESEMMPLEQDVTNARLQALREQNIQYSRLYLMEFLYDSSSGECYVIEKDRS